MAKVLCVANQKGGVTKTTTSGVIAWLLGRMGEKVLIIDFDPQSNETQLLLQVDDVDEELIETGRAKGTAYEAMILGDPSPYIMTDVLENVDLLISNDDLADITSFLYSEDWKGHVSGRLKEILKPVQDDYDFIIIDSPPTLGELLTNCLGAADLVLIPVDVSRYSKSAMKRIFKSINKTKNGINPEINVLGILPTVVNMSRKESKITPDQLKQHPEFGGYLLDTVITNTAAIGRLSERGFKDNKEILNEISPYLPIIEELMKHGK